ncbi:AAA family ATPase [Tateyamaria sp.]|uniref:AAA family ATPase n=1 Tax=Tateyamaria sp. TaxID=1929288 RepID=UPI003B218141
MTYIVGFVSQKGGVGKTSLARTLAVQLEKDGLKTLLIDLDDQQSTATRWAARRDRNEVNPPISAQTARSVKLGLRSASSYDAVILDGRAFSSDQTIQIAEAAHMTVIPSFQSLDDLEPSVEVAHSLANRGIEPGRIAFALSQVTSFAEAKAAREYLSATDYFVLSSAIEKKTGYSNASNEGRGLTETQFKSLNERATEVIDSLTDRLSAITK